MTEINSLDRFLGWLAVEQGRSERTIIAYRSDLVGFGKFLSETDVSMERATVADIERFVSRQRSGGKSPKSVARAIATLRVFHRFLVEEGVRMDDPMSMIEGVAVPKGIPKALSQDDVIRLLESVTGVDALAIRDQALLEFLYGTGARISEACGLRLSDLDMENSLVRLFGKGSKERIVPFGRQAHMALTRWLGPSGRPFVEPQQWARRDDADAVFLGVRGTRLTRQAAWGIVKKYAMRAGIKVDLSPHVLRHSCATHMLVNGADLRVVQELLGHASVTTTQVYTKVDNELLFAAYREAHPRARS
jgi:integrase/recombinase XerD